MKSKILIIEDEVRMRRVLQMLLEASGYQVKTAADGLQGIDVWGQWQPHLVISDIKMPAADGFKVLAYKASHRLSAPLILLTAFGTIDMAVDAIKKGAFDYITKPFDNRRVLSVVQQALSEHSAARETMPEATDAGGPRLPDMIGASAAMAAVRDAVAMVADTTASVMVTGESGTGKGLVARAIHDRSCRRKATMVSVNCASIPRDLLESELFGHRKGAFTGAVGDRTGAFVKAHGGTLFLDEIGDLPLELQPKLLHAAEEKLVTPIGDDRCRIVDVKIVSATNRDIHEMLASGLFRDDLYYRLNTFLIHVPPLRERREDIGELAEHFVRLFAGTYKKPAVLDEAAKQCLMAYHWPGNVRELRNVMERAVVSCLQNRLTRKALPPEVVAAAGRHSNGCTPPFDLKARERQLIVEALHQNNGNQVQAARMLNITRNTLRYRLKKYGIRR